MGNILERVYGKKRQGKSIFIYMQCVQCGITNNKYNIHPKIIIY